MYTLKDERLFSISAWYLQYTLFDHRYFDSLSLSLLPFCDHIVEFYYMFYFDANKEYPYEYDELFSLESIDPNDRIVREFHATFYGGKTGRYEVEEERASRSLLFP